MASATPVGERLHMDVFAEGSGQLGLPLDFFPRVVRFSGFRLDPMEGFPVVWRYTDGQTGRTGIVLNVPGLLNGGAMSISSNGWLYEAESQGQYAALFMPGTPKRVKLEAGRYKTLPPEASRTPLFPAEWPKAAVKRVIRARFNTIVVLDSLYLLGQVPLPPAALAPAAPPSPAPEATPPAPPNTPGA